MTLAAGESGSVEDVTSIYSHVQYLLTQDKSEGFDGARTNLRGWTGHGAKTFRDYLDQADNAIGIIAKAVNDVGLLYTNYAGVVDACHRDLVELLQTACDAYDGIDRENWSTSLTVAEVTIGFFPGGGGLSLAALAVQAVIEIVSATIDRHSQTTITRSLLDGLSDLYDATSAKTDRIKKTPGSLYSFISAQNIKQVRPNPPPIITPNILFNPDEFGLPSDMQHPDTKSISRDPLISTTRKPHSAISRRLDSPG